MQKRDPLKGTKHTETTSSSRSPSFKLLEAERVFGEIIVYTVPTPSEAPAYGHLWTQDNGQDRLFTLIQFFNALFLPFDEILPINCKFRNIFPQKDISFK